MTTLRLTLGKKRMDGGYAIRIAVNHNRSTCYIVTPYRVDKANQLSNGVVVRRDDARELNGRLSSLLDSYRMRIYDIDGLSGYSCSQVKQLLVSDGDEVHVGNMFSDVLRDYVRELNVQGRESYAKVLQSDGARFIKECYDLPLEKITPKTIRDFSYKLVESGLSEATRLKLLRSVKTLVNRGVKMGLVRYDVHPFFGNMLSASPVRKCDIGLDSLVKIINFVTENKRLAMARDVFCLSFYLGGMNLVDLLGLDFRQGKIEYIRKKTRNRTNDSCIISFSIPKTAKPIIDKYVNSDGRLEFGYKFKKYEDFSSYLGRSMIQMAKELDIKERLIFYSARKTFAQMASELGIQDAVIDYCLGHSDSTRGVIRYYTRVRSRQADMAIAKVIDYAMNPEKYEEYLNEMYSV